MISLVISNKVTRDQRENNNYPTEGIDLPRASWKQSKSFTKTPILNAMEKLIRLGSVIIKPNLTRTFVSYRIKINDEFTKQVQRSIHNLPCLFYLSFTIDLIVHLRRLSECCDLTKMDKTSSLETEPTCRSERALERILGKPRYRAQ